MQGSNFSHDVIANVPVSFRDFVLSIFNILASLTPIMLLLSLTFLMPVFDFGNNDVLNVIRHIVLRLVVVGVLFLTAILGSDEKEEFRIPRLQFEKILTLYVVSIILSVGYAVVSLQMEIAAASASLFTLFLLISLFYLIPFWFDTERLQLKLTKSFLYSFFVFTIISVFMLMLFIFLPSLFSFPRFSSIFHDPNIFARFLLIGIFYSLAFYFFDDTKAFPKWSLLVFLFLALFCFVFTLSRSGFLVLVGGMLFFSFLLKRRVAVILFIVTLALSIIIIQAIAVQRTSGTGSAVFEQSTFNRIQVILGAIDIFREHWLTGIGYTNFQNFYATGYMEGAMKISLDFYEMKGYTVSMHNWLMEVLAEQGIIGLIAFVSFFFFLIRRIWKAKKIIPNGFMKALLFGHLLMLYTYLFQGFFYHTFISQFVFWIHAGFAISTVYYVESTTISRPAQS